MIYVWVLCFIYLMLRGFLSSIYDIKRFHWFDLVCIFLDFLLAPLVVLFVLYGDFKQRFIPYKPSWTMYKKDSD